MPLLARKKIILVKIESTYGIDPTPTGAANAIWAKNINITPIDADKAKRDLFTGWLGNTQELQGGFRVSMDFEVEMAGSGTAGTAPAWGPLMRACGHAETLVAAAVTGTAQAGTTTTLTLAASGTSSTDDAYVGLPVSITGGTGSGQSNFIVAYNGTTKVATMAYPFTTAPGASSGYSVGPGAVYKPIDLNTESATIYLYIDGRLHKLTGARGTVTVSMASKAIPTLKFAITGLFNQPTDAAGPTPTYTPFQVPLMVNAVNTPLVNVQSFGAVMSAFTLEQVATVTFRNPAGGTEQVLQTNRESTGSITIEDTTVAAKDWWTAIKQSTLGGLAITHGTAAGNKVSVTAGQVQISAPQGSDEDSIQMQGLTLGFVPSAVSRDYYITAH